GGDRRRFQGWRFDQRLPPLERTLRSGGQNPRESLVIAGKSARDPRIRRTFEAREDTDRRVFPRTGGQPRWKANRRSAMPAGCIARSADGILRYADFHLELERESAPAPRP